ncbi:MAG: hydroxyacid dehydrogenase [Clostridia bacterium]
MKILVGIGESEVKESYFTPTVVEQLEKLGEIVWNETGRQAFTKEELIEHIKDVDVYLSGWGSPAVDPEVLSHAKNLKVHAHTAGSVARLVCKEEYDRGVVVLSGNDIFARSVAEATVCYMLNSLRRNEELMQTVRNGGWRMERCFNSGLYRKKVGLIGYGEISRYVMDAIKWWEPDLYLYSKHASPDAYHKYGAKQTTLEHIFSECDVISIHSAWNDENHELIKKEHFKLIKEGAVFVNTARGGILDEKALIEELETGRFRAALDVFVQEPLPEDSVLRKLKNVQCYPHMGGPTFDMREQVMFKLLRDLRHIKDGKPFDDVVTYENSLYMTQVPKDAIKWG